VQKDWMDHGRLLTFADRVEVSAERTAGRMEAIALHVDRFALVIRRNAWLTPSTSAGRGRWLSALSRFDILDPQGKG